MNSNLENQREESEERNDIFLYNNETSNEGESCNILCLFLLFISLFFFLIITADNSVSNDYDNNNNNNNNNRDVDISSNKGNDKIVNDILDNVLIQGLNFKGYYKIYDNKKKQYDVNYKNYLLNKSGDDLYTKKGTFEAKLITLKLALANATKSYIFLHFEPSTNELKKIKNKNKKYQYIGISGININKKNNYLFNGIGYNLSNFCQNFNEKCLCNYSINIKQYVSNYESTSLRELDESYLYSLKDYLLDETKYYKNILSRQYFKHYEKNISNINNYYDKNFTNNDFNFVVKKDTKNKTDIYKENEQESNILSSTENESLDDISKNVNNQESMIQLQQMATDGLNSNHKMDEDEKRDYINTTDRNNNEKLPTNDIKKSDQILSDNESNKVSNNQSGNKASRDGSDKNLSNNKSDDKASNNSDGKTSNNSDDKTSNNNNNKTSNTSDGKTSNNSDDKTSNTSDGKTSNNSDDKKSNNSNDKASNNSNDKASNNSDGKTSNNSDDKTSNNNNNKILSNNSNNNNNENENDYEGYMLSNNCNFFISLNGNDIDKSYISNKVMNFSIIFNIKSIIELWLFWSQIGNSENMHNASKISLISICLNSFIEVFESLLLLYEVMLSRLLLIHFIIMVLLKFLLFTLMEVRYVLIIWKANHQQDINDGWEMMQRKLSKLYKYYYGSILLLIILFYYVFPFFPYILLVLYLCWLPQILLDIWKGQRNSINLKFVFFLSLCRLFLPVYIFIYPYNIFQLDVFVQVIDTSNITFSVLLILIVSIQLICMFIQRKYGPRHFINIDILPHVHNYYKTIDPNFESGIPECVICMYDITLKDKKYCVTPCYHIFHEKCLQQWMNVKLECPTCRGILPNFP